MPAAERRTHLPLHGTPHPFKPRAHRWLTMPEHAPLAHVPGVGLEVQGPLHAAARKVPVERLTLLSEGFNGLPVRGGPSVLPSGGRGPFFTVRVGPVFGVARDMARCYGDR
jgi:hypothetical protein